jgi:hypothetical protein
MEQARATDNFDALFTPEMIADLDAAAAEARTGNNVSLDEIRQELEAKRHARLENHTA